MPEQIETIAENIRAQILALAPDGVRATVESLPAVAILGAVVAVGLLLVWIIFALLGAVFRGGKKKRAEEDDTPAEMSFRSDPPRRERDPPRSEPARREPSRSDIAGGGPAAAPAQAGDMRARSTTLSRVATASLRATITAAP
jgi:hypothetical protein